MAKEGIISITLRQIQGQRSWDCQIVKEIRRWHVNQAILARSLHSRTPPSSLKTIHQGCTRNNQIQDQGLQRGRYNLDVGYKEGRAY